VQAIRWSIWKKPTSPPEQIPVGSPHHPMSKSNLLLFTLSIVAWTPLKAAPSSIPMPEIYFSPEGGCTDAVVEEISRARNSILVQAYSFTSTRIAGALVSAARRGIRIEAVLDKSNRTGRYSAADFLINARIPTFIDSKHAIAHNKVIIIDGNTVITGSFNFTKAAEESNAENLLVLRSPVLAGRYTENFLKHKAHAKPYYGH
jgi:phosphatidylserine/phosphatidylglycerophosphate/cardiolipin synthase-like enzyme